MSSDLEGQVVAASPQGAGEAASADLSPFVEWRKIPGLIWLGIKIFLLRIVTLGIYHFWGKTEVRRRIWSSIHLQGQPLEYTGTGRELFIGFLIVFFLILLPIYFAFQALPLLMMYLMEKTGNPIIAFGAFGILYAALLIIVFLLAGIAIYRARRYRLSRTRWRGIRGSMSGSPASYGWTYFWTMLLVPLTLGWIIPWRNTKLQGRLTNETLLGETPLHFKASSKPLYKPFALFWIGSVVILLTIVGGMFAFSGGTIASPGDWMVMDEEAKGKMALRLMGILFTAYLAVLFLYAFYRAREFNYFAAATRFDKADMRLETSGKSLVWLFFVNGLIMALTFLASMVVLFGLAVLFTVLTKLTGLDLSFMQSQKTQVALGTAAMLMAFFSTSIASPLIASRTVAYFIKRFGLDGAIDFAAIEQNQAALYRTGEGLAEGFDIDAF